MSAEKKIITGPDNLMTTLNTLFADLSIPANAQIDHKTPHFVDVIFMNKPGVKITLSTFQNHVIVVNHKFSNLKIYNNSRLFVNIQPDNINFYI